MPITDSMFLIAEAREHPMHVGGLQLFRLPDDAGPGFVRDLVAELHEDAEVSPRLRRHPADPVGYLGNTWWATDAEVDLDYHLRHAAVPHPGRIRELFQLIALWHGSLLDRHRPMWEANIVEGIEGNRFALHTKIHHSLVDGVGALRLLEESLSTDPTDMTVRAPWSVPPPGRANASAGGALGSATHLLSTAGKTLGTAMAATPRLLPTSAKVIRHALGDHGYTTPFEAPDTILNGPIGGARRFVAQSWEIERLREVGRLLGGTLNDVLLAMCASALRDYLIDRNALPDRSLTAMVPVSLRGGPDDPAANRVGAIIASLATDIDDPIDRFIAIRRSVQAAKRVMGDLGPMEILALSGINVSALAFANVPGFVRFTRPPFNVIISNVPGPAHKLYWRGAELQGIYPTSVVLDGQALNITTASYDDHIDIGIVGCRRSVPGLQRLIHHLDDALKELEKATS